jgi:putative endopeptidase
MTLSRSRVLLLAASVAAVAFAAPSLEAAERHGIDVAGIDRSVKPGDDFFAYANGAWRKSVEIPADRTSIGSFQSLAIQTERQVGDLLQELTTKDHPAGSNERKIADYYASFMDEAAIEAAGLKPVEAGLRRIAQVQDQKQLATVLGETLRHDVDPLNMGNFHTANLFGLWVAPDFADANRYGAYLLQGGLALPDRDNYLADTQRMKDLRVKYKAHIQRVLELGGIDDAAKKAEAILDLETKIARAHWSITDSVDVAKANNRWKRDEFAAKAPGLDWDAYFQAAGLAQQPDFVVWQPSAFTGLSALVASEALATWKDWLAFHLLEQEAGFLPKAFADEDFAFHGTAMRGTPQQRERWKRAVAVTDAAIGEAVGKLYVGRYFSPETKAAAEKMVHNIKSAFAQRIDRLDWMTPATKAKAKEKVASLVVGVGYPDKWRDFTGLEVIRGDASGNHQRARLFEYHRALSQLGQKVDRGEWHMNPQLVNAINLPVQNALNFPAAILQPPFFDAKAPDAANYGGIGTTIGHEISHSFDSSGALFGPTGKLENWWTDADSKRFEAAGDKLVTQYAAYKPFPDVNLDGQLVLDENIADLGGVAAAFDAWKNATKGKAPKVDGFTGEQQFFIAYSQLWRIKFREAAARQMLLTNAHSPGEFRSAMVRNLDDWYKAFPVKPGDRFYLAPQDRVRIW